MPSKPYDLQAKGHYLSAKFRFKSRKTISITLLIILIWSFVNITSKFEESKNNIDVVKGDIIKGNIAHEYNIEDEIIEDNIDEYNIFEDNSVKNDIVKDNVEDNIIEKLTTEDENINMKYCQEKTCSFIFPYFHPEQETRANLHVRMYIELARATNRTMVLPNVGNSRIRVCKPYRFDFYFDIQALQEQYPDVRFITQDIFLEWTKERKTRPVAQHSLMIEDGRNYTANLCLQEKETMGVNEGIIIPERKKKVLCIDQFNLNFTNFLEVHSGFPPINREAAFPLIVNTLKTPPMAKKYEVIMIFNRCRREMFPVNNAVIPYSKYIIEQSKKIREKLSQYIAIHWRMEQGDPEMMPNCAKKLVRKVKEIQKKYRIKGVYLATDFPLSGNNAQSETFETVSKFHKEAIEILGLNDNHSNNLTNNSPKHKINFSTWISLNSLSEIKDDPKYEGDFRGSGIHGILDKVVCVNANFFLKTPKGCGRSQSSFTKTIVQQRKLLMENNLINEGSFWDRTILKNTA
ncbi:4817_t:CDS:2 [Scutellospora calospora]|uniref:4817_t:CDS:1 n=1 Tax=Scutellospora calospora TaxID=85575 RepID=A0ACA9K937_9GLOM|nr:4817_t:CDS:2 [Scutellospora calospora]